MKWMRTACITLSLVILHDARGDTPPQIVTGPASINLVVPMIIGGTPTGSPPDSPSLHVDPNTTNSPFAGVGSVFIDSPPVNDGSGFICSGCAIHGFTIGKQIVRDYVLMAAHCLDFSGGIRQGGIITGDGVADVAPANVSFVLNYGGELTSIISATEIHLHPDWHGFLNAFGPEGASAQDDVALLRLSAPVPAGVPTYNLATSLSGFVELIQPVGYGAGGNPSGVTTPATFITKRTGFNQADQVVSDDELSGQFEAFQADFDGPDGTTNLFDLGTPGFNPLVEGTLGNNIESTLGPGDSGGPSFLSDFDTHALQLGADGQPIVFGINTLGSNNSPAFGSYFGGMLVSRYASWIDSIMVPEPASVLLLTVGILPVVPRRKRR